MSPPLTDRVFALSGVKSHVAPLTLGLHSRALATLASAQVTARAHTARLKLMVPVRVRSGGWMRPLVSRVGEWNPV